jgi:hypothetical protein
MPKIPQRRRRTRQVEPRPLVMLQHYHPVDPSLPLSYIRSSTSTEPDYDYFVELAGDRPCFTKHRDGVLSASNLCLYLPGPLAGMLRQEEEEMVQEKQVIIDPELLMLDQAIWDDLPKTPIGKGKGKQYELVEDEKETTERMLDYDADDEDTINLSPTSSIGAISRCLYPPSEVSSESTLSPPPPAWPWVITEFVPKKKSMNKFLKSLVMPRRPLVEREPKDWPTWEEMTVAREKSLAYQVAYDRAKRDAARARASTGAGPSPNASTSKKKMRKKQTAQPFGSNVKREDRAESTDSTLTSLSDLSHSPSPCPEPRTRDPLHWRDSESLTPLPDSPPPSHPSPAPCL